MIKFDLGIMFGNLYFLSALSYKIFQCEFNF